MSDNFLKFIFLGAVILSVIWSSRFQTSQPNALLDKNFYFSTSAPAEKNQPFNQPPLLTLSSAPSPSSTTGVLPSDNHQPVIRSDDAYPSSVFLRFRQEPAPEIQAKIALVADLKSGEAYLENNVYERWPLASLTKLMSAVLAMEKMDLSSVVTLEDADFIDVSELPVDYLKPGDRYSVHNLARILLLSSRNEAAEALARIYGRSQFISGLNNLAKEWGLRDTFFQDPSGLSVANQSTAQNIQWLAWRIYTDYPEIFQITKAKSLIVSEPNSSKKYLVPNINVFAGSSGFLGGKTGYTEDASGNLLSIFSYENRPILIIVLGTEDRFGDTQKLIFWFKNNYH